MAETPSKPGETTPQTPLEGEKPLESTGGNGSAPTQQPEERTPFGSVPKWEGKPPEFIPPKSNIPPVELSKEAAQDVKDRLKRVDDDMASGAGDIGGPRKTDF